MPSARRPRARAALLFALVTAVATLVATASTATNAAAMPARDPAGAAHSAIARQMRPTTVTPATISGRPGYRLAGADGSVYSFGASYAGSWAGTPLVAPVVGVASTPRFGYWLAASDGGVASFGDARFHGSMGGHPLWAPIVGMAATPSGNGYWLVASDGGIFSFGDAGFHGSTGGMHLWAPIVGMTATATGHGYWLVASDGGVFSFGDAGFHGSAGGLPLTAPITAIASTPSGHGYWIVGRDGGVFAYGDAPFFGSEFGAQLPAPVVGIAPQRALAPYQPGTTGYDISWPQCGGPLPAQPHAITIVGVNDGRMFTANPCFGTEVAWAGASLSLYVNTAGLPNDNTSGVSGPVRACAVSDLRCRSYNWGVLAAAYDINTVQQSGAHASMWWLDVETTNTWRTDDRTANEDVIQGVLDGLRAHGLLVGIYSTSYQFGVITGGGYNPGVPLWVPTGTTNPADAVAFCGNSHSFGGGVIWLTQWWSPTYDYDYACAQ